MKATYILGITALIGLSACSQTMEDTELNSRWTMSGDFYQIADIALPAFNLDKDPATGEYKINGTTGCNKFFGQAEIIDQQLIVQQPLGMTRMLCHDTANKIEMEFIQALEQPITIKGDRMQMSNGATLLSN